MTWTALCPRRPRHGRHTRPFPHISAQLIHRAHAKVNKSSSVHLSLIIFPYAHDFGIPSRETLSTTYSFLKGILVPGRFHSPIWRPFRCPIDTIEGSLGFFIAVAQETSSLPADWTGLTTHFRGIAKSDRNSFEVSNLARHARCLTARVPDSLTFSPMRYLLRRARLPSSPLERSPYDGTGRRPIPLPFRLQDHGNDIERQGTKGFIVSSIA